MRQVLEKAKAVFDEEILRRENKPLRDQAVQAFKQKAVGQDIQEFESVLRNGLSKKYKDIKTEFFKACKTKALEYLESDVSLIKRNLQNDMYEDLDKFKDDIEKIKIKFME